MTKLLYKLEFVYIYNEHLILSYKIHIQKNFLTWLPQICFSAFFR